MGRKSVFLIALAFLGGLLFQTHFAAAKEAEMTADDPELNEQITKVSRGLEKVYQQMAQHSRVIQQETDEAKKAVLNTELDDLKQQRDELQGVLDQLVEEGKAVEGTTIDRALRRARHFDRDQERESQHQEVLRDLQK